jgi:phage terminase large subunit
MTVLRIPTAKVFQPLLQPSRYKGIYGGRGSGKSRFFADLIVETSLMRPGFRAACLREVQGTLRDSVYQLLSDSIQKMGVGHLFKCQLNRIITPGNGVLIFQGLQDHTAESIKSLEGMDVAWVEEAQSITERSLEILTPTLRAENSELWFSWNPRSAFDAVDKFFRGGTAPPNSICVKANYTDNPWFPKVLELERLHNLKTRPERYPHVWLGEYEPTAIGAIWTRVILQACRVTHAPDMQRILIAVDPAVTNTDVSDEHGIMVGGLGVDGKGYLIRDGSMKGSPLDWARRTISYYDEFDADAVVVEVNQGGDMVSQTLRSLRPSLPIIQVRATRGKHVRAEPISAMYEQGQIHHLGTFSELEGQMVQMTPAGYQGHGSPDRVDALVWLFTELFSSIVYGQKNNVGIQSDYLVVTEYNPYASV